MTPVRHILYVTGTRADFGLMQSTLKRLEADPRLSVSVLVTGMHLDPAYGLTVGEIEKAGLTIAARVGIEAGTPTGALMGANVGRMLTGFVPVLQAEAPDVVLLLGDRGEMLAGAIAAIHLNIPVAHIHGGERSGTVDEPVRHAISKLSSLHLVATQDSRKRLISMGEAEADIHVVGAPGLDGLDKLPCRNRQALVADYGLDPERALGLLVYHPVLQEASAAGAHVASIVDALLAADVQVVALKPNSDAGSAGVRDRLETLASAGKLQLFTHLPRPTFVEFMAAADLMVGNSSSGIIEAATFGTPVINIGSRQNLRERNANIIDVGVDQEGIAAAIGAALAQRRYPANNVYGDGRAGERIAEVLATADLARLSAGKTNAY
ncbi:UDP-N-acetylglucosamine 2-epimerase (hydrolyzing) [Devosia oryziradicis]|uniref:UDP-N-acetylglucosamine 2-epimerase (Hydrolyzing) n=1 Tax=Devosia oryziradicis TaxID=2801335 RepID=A0ABX7BTR8_9HYPH|nr:UDP-N-acetylglucosamine 2-epimerase [Devosia oryziradicis]QQR35348.1 UDP-N-acetylglucosamine 2-epimerase (hydrolyzing) [Devosia oryziradicis]